MLSNVMAGRALSEGETYHEVQISCSSGDSNITETFAILNLVAGREQYPLSDDWTDEEKLIPWVALAAPLNADPPSINHVSPENGHTQRQGVFYSVLPLPIRTGSPVHIHGMFGISQDRSSLHSRALARGQDLRPFVWNTFLFIKMIPVAWAKLLANICIRQQAKDLSYLWPTSPTPHEWLTDTLQLLVSRLSEDDSRVWFTDRGYVSLAEGFICNNDLRHNQKKAFQQAGMAVICLEKELYGAVSKDVRSRILQPSTGADAIQKFGRLSQVDADGKLVLLKYLEQESTLDQLKNLELFPFCDDTFKALYPGPRFVNYDKLDYEIFVEQRALTLDVERLSDKMQSLLRSTAQNGSALVKFPTAEDLASYFRQHGPKGTQRLISGRYDFG